MIWPALSMNVSAAIADSLLRQAWTWWPSVQAGGLAAQSVNILLGTGALLLGACPRQEAGQAPPQTAEPVTWAPRACLVWRLRDFATNRHDSCGLDRVPQDGPAASRDKVSPRIG